MFDSYTQDSKTMAAKAFTLGQIGEHANEIQQPAIDENPLIPWRRA